MKPIPDSGAAPLVQIDVDKWRNGEAVRCTDVVAEEVPVALEYNGISHAVMLASPQDLEDFALGFSLSEAILTNRSELFDCEVIEHADGIQVQMQISTERFVLLKDKRRNMTGRTGCGLCGAETLQQAIRQPQAVISTARFDGAALHAGMAAMQARQHMQQQSGATHAAAWMDASGAIELVREDVGRHNALDKLIGALARERRDLNAGAVLITSRASYEMVQKTAMMGIGFLAAISAPTNLAVRLAQSANVTLVGFMRNGGHVVYATPGKIT